MDIRQEVIIQDLEYWDNILIDLGVEDIRVLEIIKDNETIILDSLIKELKLRYKLKFSKNKVRKILSYLKERGLITLIKTTPLCINQMIGIENNIKKLIFLGKERYKLK